MGLGHTRPQIFLPTLLPLCVAHLMARSAPLTGQDSPGKDTGLSRKKCRTLQEEMPDSPGRNAGLSRKYVLEFFLQTIGFCERRSCAPVCVLLYCCLLPTEV